MIHAEAKLYFGHFLNSKVEYREKYEVNQAGLYVVVKRKR